MSEYRFSTRTEGSYMGEPVTVITRARLYRVGDDSGDSWRDYWDGDQMVAVYDDRDYLSPTTGSLTERVEYAMAMCRAYPNQKGQDLDSVLTRLARRIEGNYDARFISVPIDRGVTLYALSPDGDPTGAWRDEIEAVNWGDIYRVEVEEYKGLDMRNDQSWYPDDDLCVEWYGEDVARAAFEKEFSLVEFPAELLVSSDV